MSVLIIAELGVNGGGKEEEYYKLIDAAVAAKADVCKFQLYTPSLLADDKNQLAMLERLLLPKEAYIRLNAYCKEKGIGFACTAFDAENLKWLLENTEMAFVKLSSRPVENVLYHVAIASGLPVIMSIRDGFTWPVTEGVSLLHCVSKYPCPPEAANLKRVKESWCDGISDHSGSIFIALAAVALGAEIVECHLTLSKDQEGPDHKSSLEPDQFIEMIKGIRAIERALA